MLNSNSVVVSSSQLEGRSLGLLPAAGRPVVRGKFLYVDNENFWVKGVTYGTFRPDSKGNEYGTMDRVEKDFHSMVE
ncbi:MAG TPA: hypothetical protein VJ521_00665, partial [Acidobacteriota bacterium]|nr:hypothetical protein [Acidobacteriota bacterium]